MCWSLCRYEDAGPIFVVFFIIDVVVVTLNPDHVKVTFRFKIVSSTNGTAIQSLFRSSQLTPRCMGSHRGHTNPSKAYVEKGSIN